MRRRLFISTPRLLILRMGTQKAIDGWMAQPLRMRTAWRRTRKPMAMAPGQPHKTAAYMTSHGWAVITPVRKIRSQQNPNHALATHQGLAGWGVGGHHRFDIRGRSLLVD